MGDMPIATRVRVLERTADGSRAKIAVYNARDDAFDAEELHKKALGWVVTNDGSSAPTLLALSSAFGVRRQRLPARIAYRIGRKLQRLEGRVHSQRICQRLRGRHGKVLRSCAVLPHARRRRAWVVRPPRAAATCGARGRAAKLAQRRRASCWRHGAGSWAADCRMGYEQPAARVALEYIPPPRVRPCARASRPGRARADRAPAEPEPEPEPPPPPFGAPPEEAWPPPRPRFIAGLRTRVAPPEAEAPRGGIDRGGRRPPAERARRRGVAGAAEATARATRGGGAGRSPLETSSRARTGRTGTMR